MASTDKTILRLPDLQNRADTSFALEPDAETRAKIRDALGINALRKLRFTGKLVPVGQKDWQLVADLGATVVQDCVVTLEPVTTRIEEKVIRNYMADFVEEPQMGETEMFEDDTVEPLPTTIDLVQIMEESLSLYIPDFPRADGVELGQAVYTEPGVKPMTDEDARPFAGLAALKNALDKGDKTND